MATPEVEVNSGTTPQSAILRRRMAEAMLMQGMNPGPVGHWTQGAARMLQAMLGGMEVNRLERDERQTLLGSANRGIAQLPPDPNTPTAPNQMPGAPPPASAAAPTDGTTPAPTPTPAPGQRSTTNPTPFTSHIDPTTPIGRAATAISGMESSHNYTATGQDVQRAGGRVDRAYGRYQVMGDNVGPWTERWVGRRMTPQEFLASPEAQDRVFAGQFGSYIQQYGNDQDAANAWYTGGPRSTHGNNRDPASGNQTGNRYSDRFTAALAALPPLSTASPSTPPVASPAVPTAPPAAQQQPVVDQGAPVAGPPPVTGAAPAPGPVPASTQQPTPQSPPATGQPRPNPTPNMPPPSPSNGNIDVWANVPPAIINTIRQQFASGDATQIAQANATIQQLYTRALNASAPLTPLQQAQMAHSVAETQKLLGTTPIPPGTAGNIHGGLERLAQVVPEYGNENLERAIGPLAGAEPSNRSGYIAQTIDVFKSLIPRAIGGIQATIDGGANTTEVRNRIAGDTQALAASVKPLIRRPGEGTWTDADQQKLESIIGNLATASTADEYMRALQGVRERLRQNFNLDIPEIRPQVASANPPPRPETEPRRQEIDNLMRGMTPQQRLEYLNTQLNPQPTQAAAAPAAQPEPSAVAAAVKQILDQYFRPNQQPPASGW